MIKMKKRAFILLITGIVIGTLCLSAVGFCVFSSISDLKLMKVTDYETVQNIADRYGKLYELQSVVNERFLWKTDEAEQMDAMYKALLDSLGDEYSRYMTAEEYDAWSQYVTGTFTGVGITFIQDADGDFVVTGVLEDSPADLAGLKKGDIIRKVDGKTFASSEEAASALRGDKGTRVKVTYERKGKIRKVSLVRGEVEETSVYAGMAGRDIGYIRITSFEQKTAEQFRNELAAMENRDVKGIVIDVRQNPGGIVEQSLEIADMLLPECTMIHTEDRNGKKEYFNSDPECTRLNYVLLVDGKSASAAEILASAIKENQGGKLVGTTTYGKGIIQSAIRFKDQSAVQLTTMQYLSPKNHKIHKKGVNPDVEVRITQNARTDRQLEKAVDLLQ